MLADLENRFEAEQRTQVVAQSLDLAEAEASAVRLVDRLRAATGQCLSLRTRSGAQHPLQLRRCESAYLLLEEEVGLQALVPVAALAVVSPLGRPAPGVQGRRAVSLPMALREMVRRGTRVRVVLLGGEVVGRLAWVGADHLDVIVDGVGGRGAWAPGSSAPGVRRRVSVLLESIEVMRSR